jgi:hypothetical protein
MATEAIPERVYVLCRIVKSSKNRYISDKDLKSKMEPSFLNNNNSYFPLYLTAATELRLVQHVDGIVSLAVESGVVSSMSTMRRYCCSVLPDFKHGQFNSVTNAYFDMGRSVLSGPTNVSGWTGIFKDRYHVEVDEKSLRAWRFWFTYLGFGYLHGMFLIPNANVFLKDIIEISKIEKNRLYSFSDFVNRIRSHAEIIQNFNSRELNYGISNGLRTLHDSGYLTLSHILDQEDIWSLYPMPLHSVPGTVTSITING